jgi:DNA replication protein DnaC
VAREAVIGEYLKALKLPAFATEYRGLVRQATEAGWDYEDFLRELLEAELRSREERTAKRRLKEARFPEMKTLEQLDWEALNGISRQKIMELASCEFLTQAQDCIIAGPVGTGKTHVAISIGVEAARRRFRVAFYRAAELVRILTEARDERTLTLLHRRLRRADLLILDELWDSSRSSEPEGSCCSI